MDAWRKEKQSGFGRTVQDVTWYCFSPSSEFFTLAPQHVPTRGHSWKLIKPHSSTDARRFFFSVRVINKWNSLPQEAVDASSVNMFKNQAGQDPEQQDGFLYGLIVCVTLHGCTTLWSSIRLDTDNYSKSRSRHIGAAVPGELSMGEAGEWKRYFYSSLILINLLDIANQPNLLEHV